MKNFSRIIIHQALVILFGFFNKQLLLTGIIFLMLISSCGGQSIPAFNKQNSFHYLEKQCEFGARVPGTAAHLKCRDYLVATLRNYSNQVTLQPFQATMPASQKPVTCYNIIANFYPNQTRRVLLCAHWDTRPWADRDPDPANHQKPVLGANDGASGVAVLLEIARIISIVPPKFGLDIVLFDAEDFGTYGQNDTWALGSKQFAKNVVKNYHPEFGILLDLIGDADQQLYIEQNSYRYARSVVDKVWNVAQRLHVHEFIPEAKYEVYDDHLSLLEIGIPCIDIIDFDYQHWHTISDTPDKCSPESLDNVGRVLLAVLFE
ncbi:M28 family peptidase [candidate division KSB1 bacterium]|nr:M28 family peptidase [candidate division KSB1 bacterium]